MKNVFLAVILVVGFSLPAFVAASGPEVWFDNGECKIIATQENVFVSCFAKIAPERIKFLSGIFADKNCVLVFVDGDVEPVKCSPLVRSWAKRYTNYEI